MITVALSGGMGNQMFQYATGCALASRLGCRLQLDARRYNRRQAFPYALGHFQINAALGTNETLPPCHRSSPLKYMTWKYFSQSPRLVEENGLSFNENVLNLPEGVYLKGYWQSERYFLDSQEAVRRELSFSKPDIDKNQAIASEIVAKTTIAVHVRRGDYVSKPKNLAKHGICSKQYYEQAVRIIAESLPTTPTIVLFSDDIPWAVENLNFGLKTIPIGHNDRHSAHEDMRLMTLCNHYVISNSTFSWWGAWLNPSREKVVIAPKQWFAAQDVYNRDILPKNWLPFEEQMSCVIRRAS